MKRVVVTGGRDYDDWAMVSDVLNELNPEQIFVGDATGADQMARDWATLNNKQFYTFVADWKKHGKAAGPKRNLEMLKQATREAVVVAFPGGKGTENCVKQAVGLNFIVLRVEP